MMGTESLEGLIARLVRERDEAVTTRNAAQETCSGLTEDLRAAEAALKKIDAGHKRFMTNVYPLLFRHHRGRERAETTLEIIAGFLKKRGREDVLRGAIRRIIDDWREGKGDD